MPQIDFILDFASPNAYLAHQLIPSIEAATGATFNYIPCLLGGIFKATGNQAPMMANANIPSKMAYEGLEFSRFLTTHNIDKFNFNPHFPVNTLLLMRGAISAKQQGILAPYVRAGFHHMWEDPKNMADPEVFAAALTASDLDGDALLAATQDPAVKAELIANTEAAVKRGAFGIPTFYIGDEMFFGKERLAQVEAEIVRQS
ncbi:MAG: disulfide bond formation protein DsbA [Kordiimonadales bacterium]|nr:MAG: disulfide bond formation protein DsbA [Kordiimonadales bacterium]